MQKDILKLYWQTASQYPVKLWIALINPSITVLISAFAGPYIISVFLTQLQNGDITLNGSLPLIAGYAATQIYGEIIGWRITLYSIWTLEVTAERNLFHRIFNHLNEQSLSFHGNRFGGALVSQTTKLTGSFERFWDTVVFQLVPSITSIIAATVILSFLFWQYAVLLFILSLIFIATIILGSRFLARLNKLEAQASTALNGRLADAITNVLALKSHGQESHELSEYAKMSETWRQRSLDSMRGFLKVSTGYSSLIAVLNVVALVMAVWAAEKQLISIAVVYLSVTYTFTVARQLWEMNSIMRNYNRAMGDAHDMTEILKLEPQIKDPAQPEPARIKGGAISFKQATFTHDESGGELFSDFELTIAPGEKIGLVGHSGSGKTTLTKLLLRFNELDSGEIMIDGQNIACIRQADLRSHIAYVPQEPLLFHRSLRENIAYGRPDASDAEIREAAKKAHAIEFIDNMPHKFETLVGERGVKLSGGQRQRVAIARAILKDAPILVLDEATSALDSESEKLIQEALWELMKGRTAIVIAHRLSTIQKMDRIVVLDNGHIVEQGPHKDLLAKNGTYASLWKHQSGGFIEE